MTEENLRRLWDLENIGIKESPVISDDDLALESFHQSLRYKDQRYYRETTKIRVVFCANTKLNKASRSLNDYLHTGPTMLEDLISLLIRFRTYPYVLVADIEKAFLQVCLNEKDKDVTRFIWDVSKLRIPRCVQRRRAGNGNVEIHAFSDASPQGYGTVIYLRPIWLTQTPNQWPEDLSATHIEHDVIEEETELITSTLQACNKSIETSHYTPPYGMDMTRYI
ncbi:hypothetical protein M8J77_010350 [Diaphorina citri]|nr:hypothetical protein M8J77_010350 [Diaphorina citri]